MIADVVDVLQGTDEWKQQRAGLLTGSRAPDMIAMTKGGKPSTSRAHLAFQIACERIVGRCLDDSYTSRAMQWGTEHEAEAVTKYEAVTGHVVTRVGLLRHPELRVGCSPDGLVNDGEGVIEIKCPESLTHFGYLTAPSVIPSDYLGQVLHALWLSGARWADFISYDPRVPEPLQLLVVHHPSTPTEMASYEFVVRRFLEDVDKQEAAIRRLMSEKAAA